MNYNTYKFDDDLGGTFKYMDEPGRLDELLNKDDKQYRKPSIKKNYNLDIDAHALWYAHHVKSNDIKELVFWPLKPSMTTSNKFQLQVLNLLPLPYTFNSTQLGNLHALRKLAVEAGYTLTEYNDEIIEH